MPSGSLFNQQYFPLAGLNPKTVDNSAFLFSPIMPRDEDVGYLRASRKFSVFLYNGGDSPLSVSSIYTTGQTDGIILSAVTPYTILPKTSYRINIEVTLDGPSIFEAAYTFISSCAFDPTLTIRGSRIPTVSGVIGYLICEHDWSTGLSESFQWATDVMIAHDRTEQRVQLRNRARHALTLKFVETGKVRRHLENILAARIVRMYFLPMFQYAQTLTTEVASGSTSIPAITPNSDYEIDRWVVIWNAYDNYEIVNIAAMSETELITGSPLLKTWPVGSLMAPGRYANILNTRKITRHTDETAEYEVLAELMHETRKSGMENPDMYLGYQVNPFPVNW